MKVLFGMALRQTTGFVESLLQLIDLDWASPNFSTLRRRHKALKVNIPYRGSQGRLYLLIDSTGIKVQGEGEWNAPKHGSTKRRVWRKIQIRQNCSTRSRPNSRSPASPPPLTVCKQTVAGQRMVPSRSAGAIARNEALCASKRFGRTILQ